MAPKVSTARTRSSALAPAGSCPSRTLACSSLAISRARGAETALTRPERHAPLLGADAILVDPARAPAGAQPQAEAGNVVVEDDQLRLARAAGSALSAVLPVNFMVCFPEGGKRMGSTGTDFLSNMRKLTADVAPKAAIDQAPIAACAICAARSDISQAAYEGSIPFARSST